MDKSPEAFRTISEVAEALETPAHVLRFWESRFPQIRPVKRAGGRRYYRPADVALLSGIKRLLHDDGMTIRGVQKILREQGVRHVSGIAADSGADEQALEAALAGRYGAETDRSEAGMIEAEAEELAEEARGIVLPFPPPEAAVEPIAELPEVPQGESEAGAAQAEVEDMLADGLADEACAQTTAEDHPERGAPQGEADTPQSLASERSDSEHADPELPATASPESQASDSMHSPETPLEAAALLAASDTMAPPSFATAPAAAQKPADLPAPTGRAESTGRAALDDDSDTLAARLRALPRGALNQRQQALAALAARISALRESMGGPPSRN